ncbi:hypothetical protein GTY75_09090 [Streptomyces sp. SID8381]|uniref:hypothetical protein n=1 Tax=unclassified Streptomyces TaxID=2593676 RepID=UPI00037CD55D|nr:MULTISPECIES: hypothetical protein [unclassified Streptomyces]MYX26821.1 hypothetical protein [Streptomyces sp. SID8381]
MRIDAPSSGNTRQAPEPVDCIAAISQATARLLGGDWGSVCSYWGTTGYLRGPFATQFTFCADESEPDQGGDLAILYTPDPADGFPERPTLPEGVVRIMDGVCFEDASPDDGVDALAKRCAAVIRAITGLPEPRTPDTRVYSFLYEATVMVRITATDEDAAEELHEQMADREYELTIRDQHGKTAPYPLDGHQLTTLALDSGRLDQIDGIPVADLCKHKTCREVLGGGAESGECGNCADARYYHANGDHQDEPHPGCPVCDEAA